jgi:signal transduction histidine kinase
MFILFKNCSYIIMPIGPPPSYKEKYTNKSKEELVEELEKIQKSYSKLKETIARYERIATYYKSPEAGFEDLEVQKQLLKSLKEELKAEQEELSMENEELSVQVEEIIERNAELLEAQADLKDARARAELYVDVMGHDITNMNQIAMGYLELARIKIENDACLGKADLELIIRPYEAINDSSKLISNIRKIQNEVAELNKYDSIVLDEIITEAIDNYSNVPNRDITINYSNESENQCKVMANVLLKDVFLNLIGNAIKHSKNAVIIDIKTTHITGNGKNYCKVTVEDNGPGIPDNMKNKLFDRITISGVKTKPKGFGLCLTKILIDNFKGKFWVEDRVLGDFSKGAKFVVQLPEIKE